MQLQLTVKKARIETMDLLRGISLLGILLVNILAFNYPMQYVSLPDYLTIPSDLHAEKMLTIFIQGSFYPIFAWLFGYGLQMQMLKAQSLGQNFMSIGSRRLSVLLLFGLIHAFGIWYGDILLTYAVMGFIVLLLLKLKPWIQLVISLVLFTFFNILILWGTWLLSLKGASNEEYADITGVKESILAYGEGSWLDAFIQRLADLSSQLSPIMWISALFTILPFMLAGAAASQWRLIERAKELKVLWFTLATVCLIQGIWLKFQMYNENLGEFGDSLGYMLGGPILAIGYTSLVVIVAMIPYVLKITKPLISVGRMSMTTYLMQSVIQSLLFYGFGLGLYGKLSIENLVLIAFLIFIFQMAFAWIWLSFFKQGPVEMLWKRLTYGKLSENRGN